MEALELVNRIVWGIPALVLILGVGIYLSVRTGFVQIQMFPASLKAFIRQFKKSESSVGVSSYQALCTALAATVGTGNLAGVAGAICIGGPGAIFWMWICAILGMTTKFAEVVLAMRYRQKNDAHEWVGGPMYIIQNAMGQGWKWLAFVYCFFGIIAAFGVGNATQINAVVGGINDAMAFFGARESLGSNAFIGVVLSVMITAMLLGGARRIGQAAERIVPFAAMLYLVLGFGVLFVRAEHIPRAFCAIIKGAFTPGAVTGGVIASFGQVLRIGVSRGVFTNEAGMGTASIAHAGADVSHPVEQGMMGIMEVFLDTIVICTMTALVILCSGVSIPYGTDIGVALTIDAFADVYGRWISVPIAVALCCFAFATVLGWGLYGTRCAQYIFGDKAGFYFVLLQAVTVVLAACLGTGIVWLLADTVNGLMSIPNLIALAVLAPELCMIIREYKSSLRENRRLGVRRM